MSGRSPSTGSWAPTSARPRSTYSATKAISSANPLKKPERPKRMLRLGGAFCVLLVSATLFFHASAGAAPPSRLPPVDEAAARWTRIVTDLEQTVAPQLLLGATGGDHALDLALYGEQITRAEFQRDAMIVIGAVGAYGDDSAREALAASLANFPLPEGIEIPAAATSDVRVRSATLESARNLVFSLVARMQTPELSGDRK